MSGDKTAIISLGKKWGIDESIMHLFVAIARKDEAAVAVAISEICKNSHTTRNGACHVCELS